MKTLSWSICGLGNPWVVQRLKNHLRDIRPHVLFFMETKINARHMEWVRRRCGFVSSIEVGVEGSKGGLCLCWTQHVSVSLRSFSQHHIDAVVKDDVDGAGWRLTGFYEYLEEHLRSRSWSLLRLLGEHQDLPWLILGDFNEIAFSY